ncbi:Global transcription regulator sge1, partial [Spiromyces aspiralis]
TTRDAFLLFEAARRNIVPRVTRRLTDNEKRSLRSGSICIFDENEAKIKRWTDGRLWTPSRIIGNFLIYRELEKKLLPNDDGIKELNELQQAGKIQHGMVYGSHKGVFFIKPGGLLKKTISMIVPDDPSTSTSTSTTVTASPFPPVTEAAATASRLHSRGGSTKKRKIRGPLPSDDAMLSRPSQSQLRPGYHYQHLVSYFRPQDLHSLMTPSQHPHLDKLGLSRELLYMQNLRRPLRVYYSESTNTCDVSSNEETAVEDISFGPSSPSRFATQWSSRSAHRGSLGDMCADLRPPASDLAGAGPSHAQVLAVPSNDIEIDAEHSCSTCKPCSRDTQQSIGSLLASLNLPQEQQSQQQQQQQQQNQHRSLLSTEVDQTRSGGRISAVTIGPWFKKSNSSNNSSASGNGGDNGEGGGGNDSKRRRSSSIISGPFSDPYPVEQGIPVHQRHYYHDSQQRQRPNPGIYTPTCANPQSSPIVSLSASDDNEGNHYGSNNNTRNNNNNNNSSSSSSRSSRGSRGSRSRSDSNSSGNGSKRLNSQAFKVPSDPVPITSLMPNLFASEPDAAYSLASNVVAPTTADTLPIPASLTDRASLYYQQCLLSGSLLPYSQPLLDNASRIGTSWPSNNSMSSDDPQQSVSQDVAIQQPQFPQMTPYYPMPTGLPQFYMNAAAAAAAAATVTASDINCTAFRDSDGDSYHSDHCTPASGVMASGQQSAALAVSSTIPSAVNSSQLRGSRETGGDSTYAPQTPGKPGEVFSWATEQQQQQHTVAGGDNSSGSNDTGGQSGTSPLQLLANVAENNPKPLCHQQFCLSETVDRQEQARASYLRKYDNKPIMDNDRINVSETIQRLSAKKGVKKVLIATREGQLIQAEPQEEDNLKQAKLFSRLLKDTDETLLKIDLQA